MSYRNIESIKWKKSESGENFAMTPISHTACGNPPESHEKVPPVQQSHETEEPYYVNVVSRDGEEPVYAPVEKCGPVESLECENPHYAPTESHKPECTPAESLDYDDARVERNAPDFIPAESLDYDYVQVRSATDSIPAESLDYDDARVERLYYNTTSGKSWEGLGQRK